MSGENLNVLNTFAFLPAIDRCLMNVFDQFMQVRTGSLIQSCCDNRIFLHDEYNNNVTSKSLGSDVAYECHPLEFFIN